MSNPPNDRPTAGVQHDSIYHRRLGENERRSPPSPSQRAPQPFLHTTDLSAVLTRGVGFANTSPKPFYVLASLKHLFLDLVQGPNHFFIVGFLSEKGGQRKPLSAVSRKRQKKKGKGVFRGAFASQTDKGGKSSRDPPFPSEAAEVGKGSPFPFPYFTPHIILRPPPSLYLGRPSPLDLR